MEEINEDELVSYEESKEIKETIWKIWDIINDKKIISKLLLNSPLVKDLKTAHSLSPTFLDSLENNKDKVEEKNEIISTNVSEEDGKSYI